MFWQEYIAKKTLLFKLQIMSINLFESVKELFPKDFISKTASILDEKPEYIKNGISGIIPSVFTGLMQKGSTPDGLALIAQHSNDASEVKFQGSLSKIITGKNYTKYEKLFDSAEELFGEKLSDISHKVSINSGLRETSANWLVRLVTPTALGVLGEHIKKNKLSITDGAQVLAKEKDSIISAVPEEYNLTSIFGIGSLSDIGDKFSNAVSFTKPEEAVKAVETFASDHIPSIVTPVIEETIPHFTIPVVEDVIPHITPVVEEITPTFVPVVKEKVEEWTKKEDDNHTKVLTSEENVPESKTVKISIVNDAAFKWKVLSWVLLIIFFILLIILFNILPPMFRI